MDPIPWPPWQSTRPYGVVAEALSANRSEHSLNTVKGFQKKGNAEDNGDSGCESDNNA